MASGASGVLEEIWVAPLQRSLSPWIRLNLFIINGLYRLPPWVRYKIPARHRYKISGSPMGTDGSPPLRQEGWKVGKRLVQTVAAGGRVASPPDAPKDGAPRPIHRATDAGPVPRACVDVGLHRGRHGPGRGLADSDDPG